MHETRSPRQFKSFANIADPLTGVLVAIVPEGRATACQTRG
jgi:hypothetical protein